MLQGVSSCLHAARGQGALSRPDKRLMFALGFDEGPLDGGLLDAEGVILGLGGLVAREGDVDLEDGKLRGGSSWQSARRVWDDAPLPGPAFGSRTSRPHAAKARASLPAS